MRSEGFGTNGLFERRWLPASAPRAAVVIVHGYAEHSARYEHVAATFVERGYAVEALDLRGHGRSPGRRAFVRSFDEYLDDVRTFLTAVGERHPGVPVFLLGHSMGGQIAALFVIRERPPLSGIVLSAPGLRARRSAPRFVRAIVRFIGRVLPRLRLGKLDSADVSRDPDVAARYDSDPLVYRGGMAAGTLRAMIDAGREIAKGMERFALPVLLLHGAEDALTDPAGSRELFERASSEDKQLKLYPGLYHEIINEPERAEVLADIVRWLDQRAGAKQTTVRSEAAG